jgi:large subunit ribosomal protein L30
MAKEESKAKDQNKGDLIGIVLIRGLHDLSPDVRLGLKSLRLLRKHTLAIFSNSDSFKGIVSKLKDYTAYSIVSKSLLDEVSSKRKNLSSESKIASFRLSPPKGGFKGTIKKPKTNHGALGKWKAEDFEKLIKRMI